MKVVMTSRVKIISLFVVLFTLPALEAQGQFWKKWFDKDKKRPARQSVNPKKPAESEKKSKPRRKTIEYPTSQLKERYRIDVLLPLYLDELVKNNKPTFKSKVPDKALPSVSFYEGIKLAADSLSVLGYDIDVYVHDITQAGLTPEAMVSSEILSESDLIIGALQSEYLPTIADYAKKVKINFISALSPSDADIKDNPFFTMLQPTLETHCDKVKSVALRKYPSKPILLFYRTSNSVDSQAYDIVLDGDKKTFEKVSCETLPGRYALEKWLDSNSSNVIIMPIVDVSYAETVLQHLSTLFPTYRFEVFGMPSWKFMGAIRKTNALPNIGVTFTSPFYYDLTTKEGKTVAAAYKKEFGGKPSEMVFRGFDIMFWYSSLLSKYGTVFNDKVGDVRNAYFTRYDIKPQWTHANDLLYNENERIFIYRYQSGSYFVEQ